MKKIGIIRLLILFWKSRSVAANPESIFTQLHEVAKAIQAIEQEYEDNKAQQWIAAAAIRERLNEILAIAAMAGVSTLMYTDAKKYEFLQWYIGGREDVVTCIKELHAVTYRYATA